MTMLTCDVTDNASVEALVSTVLSQTGRIDVLVNNAGLGLFGGAEESSIDQVGQRSTSWRRARHRHASQSYRGCTPCPRSRRTRLESDIASYQVCPQVLT